MRTYSLSHSNGYLKGFCSPTEPAALNTNRTRYRRAEFLKYPQASDTDIYYVKTAG